MHVTSNESSSIYNKITKSSLSMKYILSHPFNFFKFSKLKKFAILNQSQKNVDTFRDQFKKMQKQNWFITCLKSLKILWLGPGGGSYLLDLFPLSNLQHLEYFKLHFEQDQDKIHQYFSRLKFTGEACEIDKNSIIGNESIVELLNLDKSLENLTLEFESLDGGCSTWNNIFEDMRPCNQLMTNILKEYQFYNLNNLNIMVAECYSK